MMPSHWPSDHRGRTFYNPKTNPRIPPTTCLALEKHGLLPTVPPDTTHIPCTTIYAMLADGPATAAELSARLGTSRDVVAGHLTTLATLRKVRRIGRKPGSKAILWERAR